MQLPVILEIKAVFENMSQPFLKTLKGSFFVTPFIEYNNADTQYYIHFMHQQKHNNTNFSILNHFILWLDFKILLRRILVWATSTESKVSRDKFSFLQIPSGLTGLKEICSL